MLHFDEFGNQRGHDDEVCTLYRISFKHFFGC